MHYKEIKYINARNLTDREFFYGHKACPGCGAAIVVRLALKVIGCRSYTVVPPGCISAVGFFFPQMSFTENAIMGTFPGTASILSGISVGAKALKIKNFYAVGFAGDGGTSDIGIQALSGSIDRNDRIIYICYDNEAYMNTGIQKSGLTPFGAHTSTTPSGSITFKKKIFEIIAAHGIEYTAVASIGYPLDFINKVNYAKSCKGTTFIHVYASCPTGWGIDEKTGVEVAKEAVDCGLWILSEYKNGEFIINKKPKTFTSINNYLKRQKRFAHLCSKDIKKIVEYRNKEWDRILKTWKIK